MKIHMPDGSIHDPKKEANMISTEKKAPTITGAREETINGVTGIAFYGGGTIASGAGQSRPSCTIVEIATELEAVQREYAGRVQATADCLARIKRLTAELRGFGKKTRAPKEKP